MLCVYFRRRRVVVVCLCVCVCGGGGVCHLKFIRNTFKMQMTLPLRLLWLFFCRLIVFCCHINVLIIASIMFHNKLCANVNNHFVRAGCYLCIYFQNVGYYILEHTSSYASDAHISETSILHCPVRWNSAGHNHRLWHQQVGYLFVAIFYLSILSLTLTSLTG